MELLLFQLTAKRNLDILHVPYFPGYKSNC